MINALGMNEEKLYEYGAETWSMAVAKKRVNGMEIRHLMSV